MKERQYPQDIQLFATIKSLLAPKPERELPLQPGSQQRYLAASDAAQMNLVKVRPAFCLSGLMANGTPM